VKLAPPPKFIAVLFVNDDSMMVIESQFCVSRAPPSLTAKLVVKLHLVIIREVTLWTYRAPPDPIGEIFALVVGGIFALLTHPLNTTESR
jgi:hypothetical protein